MTQLAFSDYSASHAMLSPCGVYRYELTRRWAGGSGVVTWIMLNPSTADATQDDPTVRRCIGFSRRWGYASLIVVNLFALRATNPAAILHPRDPVGPANDAAIARAAASANLVVAAWGNHGAWFRRDAAVLALLAGRSIHHLGTSKATGQPRHPLYLKGSERPRAWMVIV